MPCLLACPELKHPGLDVQGATGSPLATSNLLACFCCCLLRSFCFCGPRPVVAQTRTPHSPELIRGLCRPFCACVHCTCASQLACSNATAGVMLSLLFGNQLWSSLLL